MHELQRQDLFPSGKYTAKHTSHTKYKHHISENQRRNPFEAAACQYQDKQSHPPPHKMVLGSGTVMVLAPSPPPKKKSITTTQSKDNHTTMLSVLLIAMLLLLTGGSCIALGFLPTPNVNLFGFTPTASNSSAANTTTQSPPAVNRKITVVFSTNCTMHVARDHLGFVDFPDVYKVLRVEGGQSENKGLPSYEKARKLCKQLTHTWHPDKVRPQCVNVAETVFHATQTVCQHGLRPKDRIKPFEDGHWGFADDRRENHINSVFGKAGFNEAVAAAKKAIRQHRKTLSD